jgi:hypothetical protein
MISCFQKRYVSVVRVKRGVESVRFREEPNGIGCSVGDSALSETDQHESNVHLKNGTSTACRGRMNRILVG